MRNVCITRRRFEISKRNMRIETRLKGAVVAIESPTGLFRDESGFTTTSMVLSLLLTLALVFSAAQVYRVNSLSAEVQDVADAAALAAENQVAEYMIVVRFCDAVVLSLSLSGIAVSGLGVAALCTPATAPLSEGLIDAGRHLIETRDRFAARAQDVLERIQEALPFFSAACAAAVASANNADSAGSRYIGVALLVPGEGSLSGVDADDGADELVGHIEDKADKIREDAREAEEASEAANEAKQRAFMRDCGDNPNPCMYERASRLTGLSGSANPHYSSVDTWSFSVALNRAQSYYLARSRGEQPEGNAVEDYVHWKLRVQFYEYAYKLIREKGYVHESEDNFDACFPHLPKNTDEMRGTTLYTDKAYPVTEEASDDGEVRPVMHAWAGCPGATGPVSAYESVAYMEASELEKCPVCNFSPSILGQVALASTNIETGFEHHYEQVSLEAERYQKQRKRAEKPKAAVREEAGSLLDEVLEAMKKAVNKRIEAKPPGMYGAVALVVNAASVSPAGGFSSGFVSSSGSLGLRAAISASTLIDEGSEEGRNVINSLLDGLREDGGSATGAAGIVLDLWSRILSAYSEGVSSVVNGVASILDSLPLASASGLGTWAKGKLNEAIGAIGLEPAKLDALKPVLVNSGHVASKGEGELGPALVDMKQRVVAHPMAASDLFSAFLSDSERAALDRIEGLGDTIEIASIELFGEGGLTVPITIPVPEPVKQAGAGAVSGVFDYLQGLHADSVEVRSWE